MKVQKLVIVWSSFFTMVWLLASSAWAGEVAFTHKSYGNYPIPAKLALPGKETNKTIKRVVLLVHGSGPSNMDADLTKATKGGKQNLLFRDLRDGLLKEGFGVLRYHKRSFLVGQALRKKAPGALKGLKDLKKESLKILVEDAKSFVGYIRKNCPNAKVYILGASQGTYIALQVAHQLKKDVAGVSLVGFYVGSLSTLAYVQIIHRTMISVGRLDTNNDQLLTPDELKKGGTLGFQLMMQSAVLDTNKDNKISFSEIKSANMLNYFRLMRSLPKSYVVQEATYPSVVKILKSTQVKVAFFQGGWDNQTPAHHAKGIQFANKLIWKKTNMHFHFFPKLGHILDKRKRYDQLYYNPIDKGALATLAREMRQFFGNLPVTAPKAAKKAIAKPAKRAPVKKAPAKRAPSKKVPAKKAPTKKAPSKK